VLRRVNTCRRNRHGTKSPEGDRTVSIWIGISVIESDSSDRQQRTEQYYGKQASVVETDTAQNHQMERERYQYG
jgi:hypothetical protein